MVWTDPPECKVCKTTCNCYDCPSDTSCKSYCTRNNCGLCSDCKYSVTTMSHDEDDLKIFVHNLFIESQKQKETIKKLTTEINKISTRLTILETVNLSKLNPRAKPFIPR